MKRAQIFRVDFDCYVRALSAKDVQDAVRCGDVAPEEEPHWDAGIPKPVSDDHRADVVLPGADLGTLARSDPDARWWCARCDQQRTSAGVIAPKLSDRVTCRECFRDVELVVEAEPDTRTLPLFGGPQ